MQQFFSDNLTIPHDPLQFLCGVSPPCLFVPFANQQVRIVLLRIFYWVNYLKQEDSLFMTIKINVHADLEV